MLNTFKKALEGGWKPKIDATIREDANVTWFAQDDMYIVPSDKGAVQLDEEEYELAKAYVKENNGR